MDSNKKKINELLNLDLIQDKNITIDNLKDFDLDAHFDSDLNLDFDLELESNCNNTKGNQINDVNNRTKKQMKCNKKEEEAINENQFEDLLSGFKDKYDTNNKKRSQKAMQKQEAEKESTLLINSVIKEHKKEITKDTELDAHQYDMLLKNIQIDNKQNIEGKQLNKFQKILGINDSEIEESYKNKSEKEDSMENYSNTGNDNDIDIDTATDNDYNLDYLDLLIQFYLDFENYDFKNNSQLFFLVSKLENYEFVSDISKLKNGDIIKYPVVKYNKNVEQENCEDESIPIPDLIPVFFIKKRNNKLQVSKHNNCWLIWEDIPLFKKIND